jgi:hypothetical protein
MSYKLRLSPEAEIDLRRLPPPVALFTARQLINLADDPTILSKPSHFPYPQGHQLMSCDYDHESRRWFINVLFRYASDEATLEIVGISAQAAEEWFE